MNFGIRALLALCVALAVTAAASALLIPVLRRRKLEQHVREDGPKSHLSKEGTPTMGGIMIVMGLLCAVLLLSFYSDARSAGAVFFLVCGTLAFTLIGFLDDFIKLIRRRSLGLRAWQKIVLQLAAAVFVAVYSYAGMDQHQELIPFTREFWDLGRGYVPFTMFVFLAMVNSVNLTDGLDGLAASCVMINGAALFAIVVVLYPALLLAGGEALIGADGIIADTGIFLMALVGACLGFLCFNRHPAKVFMGDTGSFALGAALTVAATTLELQLTLPIMGFVYVMSSVSVIIQVGSFKLRHKRVFRMAPLHHHFELMGIPETRVVGGYMIVTVVLSMIAVLSAFV
ncbi:MAG: phospho-N-acetylmuramoyl-pentapeptide-transferase [Clostridia bacterium]|nr:phospho-N-acetylmuramoyl-pentapeptide-transferase [Clostridia bacterium]